MSTSENQSASSDASLADLHKRVNDMLDIPLPDESEAWSLRLDTSPANIPPGHPASGTAALEKSPD